MRVFTDGSEDLRALQGPLKERYRADPEAAIVTLSANGDLGDGTSCSVRAGSAMAAAGLHPASGGDGALLCSGDMLLEALWHARGSRCEPNPHRLGFPWRPARCRRSTFVAPWV